LPDVTSQHFYNDAIVILDNIFAKYANAKEQISQNFYLKIVQKKT